MNGRCCVFQPFDKGPHDKRYEDTIAPAIKLAGLEPYRVDRDEGAVIPVETLHEEIRSAVRPSARSDFPSTFNTEESFNMLPNPPVTSRS
jgi:hypothetical protein